MCSVTGEPRRATLDDFWREAALDWIGPQNRGQDHWYDLWQNVMIRCRPMRRCHSRRPLPMLWPRKVSIFNTV